MKIRVFVCISLVLMAGIATAGDLEFERFQTDVQNAVPEGYSLDASRTRDSRFAYSISYNKDGSEGMDSLIFSFNPGAGEFTEMQKAFEHVAYDLDGRKAIFADGESNGMAFVTLILKNGAGRFQVMHRNLENSFLDRESLESLLAKIDLAGWEN
jgi:hypothetical protein